jgi:hypothetical protein
MSTTYRIHPGIGIARLGNSPDGFCISPEEPAALPIACDEHGNPLLSPDGRKEARIKTFKDIEGRIKRQAARFQIWAFDDQSPEGRPLKIGDRIAGGGNSGVLVDIQWRVHLANKKASWYEFRQLDGEHGYAPGHPRRNARITEPAARQRLIIDPGPRSVDCTKNRRARFGRDGGDAYASTFPPPLRPASIDSLGDLLTDDSGRLLVLGGHGHSGSYRFDEFGQPRIDDYANNDGWFDDTSDGPVMARLVMYEERVKQTRFVDVEYPAWVIAGYPAYVPEILDIVTMDDVLQDLAVREFAERTDLYGTAGTFAAPQHISTADQEALTLWRASRLRWNPEHRPWFYRDIWTILFRPDEYNYLCNVLGMSNYPHNRSTRGTFDPSKLGVPPKVDWNAVARAVTACMRRHHSGELFVETLAPALQVLEKPAQNVPRTLMAEAVPEKPLSERFTAALQEALASYARAVIGDEPGADYAAYLRQWREGPNPAVRAAAKQDLERAVAAAIDSATAGLTDEDANDLRSLTTEQLRHYQTGNLLEGCRRTAIEANTQDSYRADRQFLVDLLRQHGEENHFMLGDKPASRVHDLPLMPLLAGDNPISNQLPSKFLRLTDYQYYLLRQWARGLFYNEKLEGWGSPEQWHPYAGWVNRTARDLDRGVLSNVLGGAFCPGGEVGWVMRNPAIYRVPYRIKADPAFYSFGQTAAQANSNRGEIAEIDYASYGGADLSQDNNFDVGLQPGDLTKYMALPWQADFNECAMQSIDVTYEAWNKIYPDSDHDGQMKREQRVWETLWWPAHRPLQTYEFVSMNSDGTPNIKWLDWSRGVPPTTAGDLKMVSEWWRLSFVKRNPWWKDEGPTSVPPDKRFISVERTEREDPDMEES